ncbi:hypothetical protein PENTCL1PPCAC_16305, partial [Pristionchus entomophagus]
ENSSLPLIKQHWVNVPADMIYRFYLWEITNPDEVFINMMGGTLLGTEIPDEPKAGGIFALYNNSYEPEFRVRTGLRDISELTKYVSYGGQETTHWNISDDLQNCSDGAFNKQFLQPEDKLHVFVSYLVRAFEMEFHERRSYDSIPTFVYRVDESLFNTNDERTIGMRYENTDGIDYFPTWPSCPVDHVYNSNNTQCANIDCSKENNFCNDCCDGSHHNGTVYFPPGFYAARVFPGRIAKLPVAMLISPPHMLWAPKDVRSSYTGQSPDEETHRPVEWTVNPTLGAAVHAVLRAQVNIPLWKGAVTKSSSLPTSIAPIFWLHLEVVPHDDILFIVKLASLYVPLFFDCGIVLFLLVAFISTSIIAIERISRMMKRRKPITQIRIR